MSSDVIVFVPVQESVLGGSMDLVSKVISTLIHWVISSYKYSYYTLVALLITLVAKSHASFKYTPTSPAWTV